MKLNRKRSQSHHHSNSNKKLKGDFESSLPSNTTEKKPIMFKNEIEDEPESEKTEEALDKATNSYDLGSYLSGLSSSSYKNPKRKYLSKRKPMSTTLAVRNELLYRASDSKTKMKDAREAILALAPDDFTISLSSCFNYTQNFRKGTLEAKRHHEGRGVNACLSLHKAPDTAPIKEKVINIHWTSSNVNYVLDKASKDQNNYCVDLRDAKQVIRANTGQGG